MKAGRIAGECERGCVGSFITFDVDVEISLVLSSDSLASSAYCMGTRGRSETLVSELDDSSAKVSVAKGLGTKAGSEAGTRT